MFSRLAILCLFVATPLAAQETPEEVAQTQDMQSILEARAADAVSVLNGEQDAQTVFAPGFLKAVSPEQLAAFHAQLSGQFGALIGVERVTQRGADRGVLVLQFENATGAGGIAVDPNAPHLITELVLTSFNATDDSLNKVKAELDALPGDVGLLFKRLDGTEAPIMSINPDRQLAIGSTFKLYILSALARSIENGERSWSDVLTIDRKSFPSGTLQDWPDGAPVTLHTLATLMISISDNTATDLLLRHLGRETVEAELLQIGHSAPDRTLPFLSTLEMFALKGSEGNLAKYIAADEAGKRLILADFEDDVGGNRNLITPPRFVDPTAIDSVEWFASGNDLARLADRLSQIEDPAARAIMAVNTALPQDTVNEWLYVGYKGGSEPGVLNLTWLLQDEAERWHIMALSWNNTEEALDHTKLEQLAQRLVKFAF